MAFGFAQERVALGGGAAAPVDVELEKGRQGPVNRVDLRHVDGVAERRDLIDVFLRERQGSAVRQAVPRAAVEAGVGAGIGPPSHVRGRCRRGRGWGVRGGVSGAHGLILPHMGACARPVFT